MFALETQKRIWKPTAGLHWLKKQNASFQQANDHTDNVDDDEATRNYDDNVLALLSVKVISAEL